MQKIYNYLITYSDMKKSMVIVSLIIGLLILVPVVSAQTYSGFDRFVDNVKMVFTFGDKKVVLALDIREKEVNSAIESSKNGDEDVAIKNLERARERLQYVQEKVTIDTAEDVKSSSNNIIETIDSEENLPDGFEVYVLEEKKTQLTAELVVKVEGKEGQTEIRVVEGKLGEVNNDIKGWVVEHSVAENGEGTDNGLTWEIKTDIASGDYGGDDGLTWEVKTYAAGDGTLLNDPLPEPDLSEKNYDPSKDEVITNNIENIVVSGGNTVDSGDNTVDDTDVSGGNPVGDVGGVDDGPGEPGVVDED